MKRGICPKCNSSKVYFREYALNSVALDGKNVENMDYIFTDCGYFETYITDKNALGNIAAAPKSWGIGRK